MRATRLLASCLALAAICSCAQPPQQQIDAARAAVQAAERDPDVVLYAPDSLRAAQEALNALDAELQAQSRRSTLGRSYDATKDLARRASQAAASATASAQAAKQQVARQAAALVDELNAAVPDLESKLWAARRVKGISLKALAPLASLPEQARAVVEDAQRDIEAGSFAEARAKLRAALDALAAAGDTIAEQTRLARGR
jgi:hypothetical protein